MRAWAAGILGGAALLCLPTAASSRDWTQLYFGASVGADAFTGSGHLHEADTGQSIFKAAGPFGADIGASFTVGGDYQLNRNWVVGALLSYDWSRSRTEATVQEGPVSAHAALIAIDRMWFAGGRLGFLVTDKTLVYGLLGYSWLSVEDLKLDLSSGGTSFAFRLPLPSSQGVTVGGGIEHKLANNVSLRAEYRMTDYGREIIFQDAGSSIVMTGQAQSHVARIGAFFRFGPGGEAEAEADAWSASGTWSGLHLGAGLALASYLRDLTIQGVSAGHVGDKFELSGLGGGNLLAGVSAGYDFQIAPRVIAGIIATFDAGTQNHDLTFSVLGSKATIDLLNQKYGWSLGGRIGYLLSPSLLGYVSGGFA